MPTNANIYEQDKSWSQLSWACKKFYNLRAWVDAQTDLILLLGTHSQSWICDIEAQI